MPRVWVCLVNGVEDVASPAFVAPATCYPRGAAGLELARRGVRCAVITTFSKYLDFDENWFNFKKILPRPENHLNQETNMKNIYFVNSFKLRFGARG